MVSLGSWESSQSVKFTSLHNQWTFCFYIQISFLSISVKLWGCLFPKKSDFREYIILESSESSAFLNVQSCQSWVREACWMELLKGLRSWKRSLKMKWKPKLRQLGIEIQRLYKVFEGEGIATNRAIQKMYLEELTKDT